MRIAQVAPLQGAIPPSAYGGTERVVHNLTEALVRLGHDVTLFASGDSQTSAHLVPMVDHALRFNPEQDANAIHVAMLEEIYTRYAGDFDVIHSHLDYLTLPFLRLTRTPSVLTLHGRLERPEWNHLFNRYRHAANFVSISDDQRRTLPDLNWVATVHHGVDVKDFTFYPERGDYLAFVGRMSPERRPDVAIEVAKRTGLRLKVAAKVDHKEEPYFKGAILPLLDHPLIEWLGEVDERQKRELVGNALALLAPIDRPEPFGLVFIEALACGTPVVTCPIGSVPELLEDGLTGFTGANLEELVDAVRKVRTVSRRACRAYAERRFSVVRMARDYVAAYTRVLRGGSPAGRAVAPLSPEAPPSSPWRSTFEGAPGHQDPQVSAGQDDVPGSDPLPEGLTPAARRVRAQFERRYKARLRKVRDVALSVLVWGPHPGSASPVAVKRVEIRDALRGRGHNALFSEELEGAEEGAPPLKYREFEQARLADFIIILVEDAPGAMGEAHDFCNHPEIATKVLIMMPEDQRSSYSAQAAIRLVDEGYGGVYWYQEGEIASCNVLSRALTRVEARRTIEALRRKSRR